MLKEFLNFAAHQQCDLIVDLGDRISDVDSDTDFRLQQEVASWLLETLIPIRHINGNHDVEFLDQSQLTAAMGKEVKTSTLEMSGYNLVFWCGSAALQYKVGIVEPSEVQLRELHEALTGSPLPAIIFSHIPLNHPEYTGHFVHERVAPEAGRYAPEISRRVREILERSERAVLCINGHLHWNAYHAIDGIHYISVPSLTELFTSYPEPAAAWSILTIDGPEIRLQVFGNTPIEYRFPVKSPLNRHWLNVDKDYSPAKITPA